MPYRRSARGTACRRPPSAGLLLFGLIASVASLVWTCCGDLLRLRGALSDDQVWIELKAADESFAQETQRGLYATVGSSRPLRRRNCLVMPRCRIRDVLPGL